jgi:hypothetical protein
MMRLNVARRSYLLSKTRHMMLQHSRPFDTGCSETALHQLVAETRVESIGVHMHTRHLG